MRIRRAAFLLLATFVLATLFGCSLVKRRPPEISSLTLTDQVDPHRKSAVRPLAQFEPGTSEFFASVRVLRPVKGTRVAADWYFDGKLVDSAEVLFDRSGSRYVAFNLVSASQKPFPAGSYKVKIYLDGTSVREAQFDIE